MGHLGKPRLPPGGETQFSSGEGLDGPPVFASTMGLIISWLLVWATMFWG
jgi:hypothetical protein